MVWGWGKAEYAGLVQRYREYRGITWTLNNEILPKYLSKSVLDAAGRAVGMLRGNTLVMDNEDDIGLLIDYAIHDCREKGGNAVARYRPEAGLDPESDEYKVVKALSESFYTLVGVSAALPGVGIRVVDLLAERKYLLIDMAFSRTGGKGLVLATRILPYGEFVATSGVALPVDAETLEKIHDSILPKYEIAQEGKCILAGGRRKAAELTAAVIRLCLRRGASDRIRYEGI
jgi:hypothetical protein